MHVIYLYKNKEFDDIRDIVQNNNLEIDYQYIMEEYIPFQSFITGRTIFKGLTIKSSICYDPQISGNYKSFDKEVLSNGIKTYLDKYGFDKEKKFTGAVSGGVDSSLVALEMEPEVIYSGYYDTNDEFFDETPYSSKIAKTLNADHKKYKLDEIDFLENVDEIMDAICAPIAGMGVVMEYSTLKKAVKDMPDMKQIFFGNGGDEIFMGYFFNYYVKEFYEDSYKIPGHMPNFLPSKKNIAEKMIDMMVVASLNRGGTDIMYSSFVVNKFIPILSKIPSVVDKLLYVNINMTLPTLLHLNNQFCRVLGIKGLNPLANEEFIKIAKHINSPMSEIPKQALREVNENMPQMIKDNRIKRGFPIPTDKWDNLNDMMRNAYDSFFKRPEVTIHKMPYKGINRYSWGVFQAETYIRKYKKD